MLTPPKDIFCQIEAIVTADPSRLDMGHYHTMPDGSEAFAEVDILSPRTNHCLVGWVIALTPRAARFERGREEVVEFANEILRNGDRPALPWGIIMSDEASALKVIKGRAAEEREAA